ncbi:hypothetical protein [uncultured Pseudodesulfovibrio sp.]|uniref:hypothetical protein n=1 Tax=uncultured Pseudodesulfovibrio sp. TaxID=2035858 RepID=UPI0029C733D0|nr:hypothetical protein [uncultured Pseudodesulfovibrio sp.]
MFEEKIDDRYFWAGIGLTFLGIIINLFAVPLLSIVSMICSLGGTVCFICDYLRLKANDLPRPHWAWLFLFPVYAWKRCVLLKGSKLPFWATVGLLVVWLGATGFLITHGLGDIAAAEAKPIVTRLIKENLDPSLYCSDVEVTEELRPGRYDAVATVSNGMQFNIRIKVKKDGEIYVRVLE